MENGSQNDPEGNMEELTTALHHLLEGQLAAGHEGNFARMVQLSELANAVVGRMIAHGSDVPAGMGARRRELKQLYDELILMLRAEQADVQGKLKQLRQMKRAVGAYRTDR